MQAAAGYLHPQSDSHARAQLCAGVSVPVNPQSRAGVTVTLRRRRGSATCPDQHESDGGGLGHHAGVLLRVASVGGG